MNIRRSISVLVCALFLIPISGYAIEQAISLIGSDGASALLQTGGSVLKEAFAQAKNLDFYTSSDVRLVLPFGKAGAATIEYPLGGAGAGLVFEPFIKGESGNDEHWACVRWFPPGVSVSVGAAASDIGFEVLRMVRGAQAEGLEDSDGSLVATLAKTLDIRVTPGRIFLIKFALLMKHYMQHGSDEIKYLKEAKYPVSRYLIHAGILLIRLMKTWGKYDVAQGGGITQYLPKSLREMLEKASKQLPTDIVGDSRNFLLDRLEDLWQIVTGGSGVEFNEQDGSVRLTTVEVTKVECANDADAEKLEKFLTRTVVQVAPSAKAADGNTSWRYVERRFYGQSFESIMRKLIASTSKLKSGLDEGGETNLQEAARVYSALGENAVHTFAQRYDSLTPREHELMENAEFVAAVGEKLVGGVLSAPILFRVKNALYYCSPTIGFFDGMKLAGIIFFRAVHEYLAAMTDPKVLKEIGELDAQREQERKYLVEYPEGLVSCAYVEGVGKVSDTDVAETLTRVTLESARTPAQGINELRLERMQRKREQTVYDVATLYAELRTELAKVAGVTAKSIELGDRPTDLVAVAVSPPQENVGGGLAQGRVVEEGVFEPIKLPSVKASDALLKRLENGSWATDMPVWKDNAGLLHYYAGNVPVVWWWYNPTVPVREEQEHPKWLPVPEGNWAQLNQTSNVENRPRMGTSI